MLFWALCLTPQIGFLLIYVGFGTVCLVSHCSLYPMPIPVTFSFPIWVNFTTPTIVSTSEFLYSIGMGFLPFMYVRSCLFRMCLIPLFCIFSSTLFYSLAPTLAIARTTIRVKICRRYRPIFLTKSK